MNSTLERLGWNDRFDSFFQQYAQADLIPGRIARVDRKSFLVITVEETLNAALSGKFQGSARRSSEYPAVGDWVACERLEDTGRFLIRDVLPRITSFSRKTAGDRTQEQVLAANVDILFVVTSFNEDFNLSRLERYLTLVNSRAIRPVIVINKADLTAEGERYLGEVRDIAPGVPVHAVSALTGDISQITGYLEEGVTVAFIGSSGVGKSSIINAIMGIERQPTGDIRESDGRGRHVTANRELIVVPGGGIVIDNPGIRELQLWADEDSLADAFRDIEELAEGCRFRDCAHSSEPGCAVKDAVEKGRLGRRRYRNYLKLRRELQYLAERQETSAARVERKRWKHIRKYGKHLRREKGRE